MLVKGEERKNEISRLNLPVNILKLTNGVHVHPMLKDDCRALEKAIDMDASPSSITVIPLWKGHSSLTGFHHKDESEIEFIKYEFEYADRYEILGPSIHSVITNLLVWYWTEEEAEDDDLRNVASILEYPYIDRLLKEIEVASLEEHEDQDEWEKRFRLTLSAIS